MKKLSIYAIAAFTLMLTSCKKDKETFPTKAQSNGVTTEQAKIFPIMFTMPDADGMLAAVKAYNYKTVVVNPYLESTEYGMASFTATKGDFSNLTDAGTVTLDTTVLQKNTALQYLSSLNYYSINLQNLLVWNVSGGTSADALTYTATNLTFPKDTLDPSSWGSDWLPPVYKDYTAEPFGDQRSKDSVYDNSVAFKIPNTILGGAANCDTIIIRFKDNNGTTFVRGMSPSNSQGATFYPYQFQNTAAFDNKSLTLEINAIKIDHISTMPSGRKYYFLKQSSYIKYLGTN